MRSEARPSSAAARGPRRPATPRAALSAGVAVALALALAGCRQDMHDQPRHEGLEASRFFADGQAARLPVPGTVARGELRADRHLYAGLGPDGAFATALPASITLDRALLERGQDRFAIFCSPCHDRVGSGRGMIVRRGFKSPQSFHSDRLRAERLGYFFDVMTNGFGQMSSYAAQVPVADRWAIAAYIRALQLSQHAPAAELAADDRAALASAGSIAEEAAPEPAASHGAEGGDAGDGGDRSEGGHGADGDDGGAAEAAPADHGSEG